MFPIVLQSNLLSPIIFGNKFKAAYWQQWPPIEARSPSETCFFSFSKTILTSVILTRFSDFIIIRIFEKYPGQTFISILLELDICNNWQTITCFHIICKYVIFLYSPGIVPRQKFQLFPLSLSLAVDHSFASLFPIKRLISRMQSFACESRSQ